MVAYILRFNISQELKSRRVSIAKWYRNNEIHRFDQPIGKQYTFGHGPEFASELEKKDRQNAHLKMENDILKKYLEIKKELEKE